MEYEGAGSKICSNKSPSALKVAISDHPLLNELQKQAAKALSQERGVQQQAQKIKQQVEQIASCPSIRVGTATDRRIKRARRYDACRLRRAAFRHRASDAEARWRSNFGKHPRQIKSLAQRSTFGATCRLASNCCRKPFVRLGCLRQCWQWNMKQAGSTNCSPKSRLHLKIASYFASLLVQS